MQVDHGRLRDLFIAACDLPVPQQSQWVDEQCAAEPELRAELQRLLLEDRSENGLLAEDHITDAVHYQWDTVVEEVHPEQIGQYAIKKILGQGGMGVVYLAEQANPKRDVALKVIRAGVMNRELIRRFEFETRVLARLQHPGIAKIHEAGVFKDNSMVQPYFAMDYIVGRPLDEFIRIHQPTSRERLIMFTQICDAVEHAHQRGVIHRDLKPSNILINLEGQAVILDFGVARTTETDLQGSTLQTTPGQLIGTVPYMSPEQVTGRGDEVDTRSDVYALGVVIYQMLTEKLPHDLGGKQFLEAAKTITEREPTPLADSSREFRGDLNTIVHKAMEKDRKRRYQSAAAFSDDVRRYLNDQPVLAKPGTILYQLRKFTKRNKMLVAAVTGIITMLILGAGGATMGMLKAQRDARHVSTVNEFMAEILVSPDPSNGNANVKMVDVLREAAQKVPTKFREYPETEADVSFLLGKAFTRLTQFDDAIPLLRRAYDLRQQELGPHHALTKEAASALIFAQVQRNGKAAIDLGNELLTQLPDDQFDELFALDIRRLVAAAKNRLGEFDQAEIELREILEVAKISLDLNHPLVMQTKNSLALVLKQRAHVGKSANPDADLHESIELFRGALNMYQNESGHDSESALRISLNLVDVLRHVGELEEAEQLCHQVVKLAPGRFGPDHEFHSRAYKDLAYIKYDQQKYQEAADYCIKAIDMTRRRNGKDNVLVLVNMVDALPMMEAADRFDVGEQYSRVVIDKLGGHYGERTDQHRLYLARFLSGQGKSEQAAELFDEIVESGALESSLIANCFFCLFMGEHKLSAGELTKANELFEECLSIRKNLPEKTHPRLERIQLAIERAKN